MHKFPSFAPVSSLLSPSTNIGLIPKKGFVADPGFVSVAPGNGVIKIPPVSVCHHVSTIGQLFSPMTSLYQFQASGFIGSPTVPSILRLFLLVFLLVHPLRPLKLLSLLVQCKKYLPYVYLQLPKIY